MSKKILVPFIFLLVLSVISACSNNSDSSDSTTIKIGTKMPENSPEGEAFNYFADLVEEKSDGDIEVKVYPDEQLGGGTAQIDNLNTGSQDIYAESSAFFDDCDDRFEIASAPFLFEDYEQFREYMLGEVGQEMATNMEDNCGLKIINDERNFQRGPYRVMMSKDPVKSLDDMKGLKLRLAESKLQTSLYEYLGATPTEVDFSETYLSINQGVVEAVNSPVSQVSSMKFAEVAPNMTITNEYPQEIVFVMNKDKFDRLTEEEQKIIVEASNETGEKGTELAEEAADEDIDKMKEENDLKIHEINTEKWTEELIPFYEKFEEDGNLPEGTIESIKKSK